MSYTYQLSIHPSISSTKIKREKKIFEKIKRKVPTQKNDACPKDSTFLSHKIPSPSRVFHEKLKMNKKKSDVAPFPRFYTEEIIPIKMIYLSSLFF